MNARLLSVLLFLAVLSGSCENWLDVTSSDEIKSSDQFEKESGFKDGLIGVYITMANQDLYAKASTWYFMDLLAQGYRDYEATSVKGFISNYNYKNQNCSPFIEEMWNKSYNVIVNINHVLKYIDEKRDVLDPINYSLIKGELLGLRAFLHFDLLRQFGYGDWQSRSDLDTRKTIPYVREYSKDITPQLSYAETFKLLEADMDAAASYLKEDPVTHLHPADYYKEVNADRFWDNRQMRMNYYAVKALQARAYLWEGSVAGRAKALAVAKEVIGSDIYKWISKESLFSQQQVAQDMTFTTEYLFGLNVTNFSNIIKNNFTVELESDSYNALCLTSEMAYSTYEIITDWIENPDDPDGDWIEVTTGPGLSDYRYMRLLADRLDRTYFVPLKLRQVDGYWEIYRNRMPLMKIAEMYYIAAECYVTGETPDLTLAREQLNTVREHRGIATKLDESLNAEEIMNEILKEYRKEFVCEGQLFYYYKRTGAPEIQKSESATPIKMTDEKYMLPYPIEEVSVGNRVQ